MSSDEGFRSSDPTVVARYLQIRSLCNDRLLTRVETLIPQRYVVEPTRRLAPTLVAMVRSGFVRPAEGEVWPVLFLTPVDITVALCVQISEERLASLGTLLNGPRRIRHRQWEDWWGWEKSFGALHPRFFDLATAEQEDAALAFYTDGLEWLVHSSLLQRRENPGRSQP